MHRQSEHVYQFFMAEMATEGSIDANQRLIIKGRYVPKQIESLLKKYIGTHFNIVFIHWLQWFDMICLCFVTVEYVTCHMCRSPGTTLSRGIL